VRSRSDKHVYTRTYRNWVHRRKRSSVNVCFSVPYLYHTSSTMQRPTWLGLGRGLWRWLGLVVRVGRCMVLNVNGLGTLKRMFNTNSFQRSHTNTWWFCDAFVTCRHSVVVFWPFQGFASNWTASSSAEWCLHKPPSSFANSMSRQCETSAGSRPKEHRSSYKSAKHWTHWMSIIPRPILYQHGGHPVTSPWPLLNFPTYPRFQKFQLKWKSCIRKWFLSFAVQSSILSQQFFGWIFSTLYDGN